MNIASAETNSQVTSMDTNDTSSTDVPEYSPISSLSSDIERDQQLSPFLF